MNIELLKEVKKSVDKQKAELECKGQILELYLECFEKQIPKKPLRDRRKYFDNVNCKCGYRFFSVDKTGIFAGQKSNFCPDCGQRIDWSGER